jgi:hypothetical protein
MTIELTGIDHIYLMVSAQVMKTGCVTVVCTRTIMRRPDAQLEFAVVVMAMRLTAN